MSLLPSPIPHPLDYSPWDLPGWVYEALDWVIGVEWPEGDERAVWDLADQWYGVAAALAGPCDDAIAAAAEVRSGYGGIGLVAEAFDTAWRRVAEGDEAPLLVLLAVSNDLGRLVEECGCDIEGAKLEVWIELGILVVELLAIAVASVVTAGAASPAVGAATTASRLVIQQIFRRLLAQLAKKELKQGLKEAGERAAKEVARGGMRGLGKRAARGGLEEAAEESGISLATQAYQNSTGRRDGLDLADLGASAVGGLAGGAVAPLAGLGRHANGRGARIVEHFGREMTGETLAEGAAGLATGQGVMSLEDAARAAVSGATGSATGQVDAAVRARVDGQLSALAAPLPPMELPLVSPAVAAGDLPSPRDGSSSEAGASALSGGSGTGAALAASLADAAPPAPQPDREPVAVGQGDPVPAAEVGSASDRGASAAVTVDAAASTQAGHGPSSGSPTLSSVTAERPPSPQVGEAPATATQSTTTPTAANPVTSAPVTTGPVTTSATTATPTTLTSPGTVTTSTTVTSQATVTSSSTGAVGSAATSAPLANPNGSASAHPPVAAAHGSPPAVTAPPVQRPNPAGAEGPLPQGPGTPEQDVDVATRNRFPSLEALAPATSPLPEAQPSPVPPAPSTERPRPRTPEWYAAKWAAEREALERRRYQGYFESQRAWYEDKRRFDAASRRKDVARTHEERARRSARRAIELQREGRVEMADWFQRLANQDQLDAFDEQDLADDILAGRVVPDEVLIDNPADFQRINDDVADLALGAVETSDRSALTGADDDPPPIDRSRRYGQWGGLRPPLALHQTDLERQMPRHPDGNVVRTADPRQGGWFALANDGGPQADPTRGINCLDCTLSLFETWVHGRPRVSAPRTFDGYAAGDIRCPIMGEKNGPRRVEQVTGGRFQKLVGRREAATDTSAPRDAVDRGFENLRVQLKIGGHGSYAFLITEWENGGSHAWVALNQNGTILYLDPQSGAVHDQPLYRHQGVADPDNVISVDALVLGGDGRPMPLGGLARGQFSVLPDLPDHPSTPEDEAGYGDPYLNRLHLLDGPGGADSTGTSQGAGSEAALSPPVYPEETADPMAQLSAVDRNVLNGLRRRAESVADAVEACLAAVCDRVTAVLGGDRVVTMRDQEFRLKSSHSLARKFLDEAVALGMTAEEFSNEVNDVLRFCLVLPAADHYATAIGQVLDELRRDGFHVEDQSCKNFWRVGNRFYGFNCTVRSPAGQVFELQLHTESSRAAWLGTHHAYEVLRRSDSPAVDRLEALLEMLAVNKRAGLPDEVPSELEPRFPTKDGSFAKWITAYPATWLAYRRALEVEGLSLADVAHRLGLTRLDFPITPELERRMEQASVDLLRSVP